LNFVDQEIVLDTEESFGENVPIAMSSALLRRLEDTARPCVRMAIEGASAAVGAVPNWLERASDIRTVGFSGRNGQSILHLRAPRLFDAAPDLFEQPTLWPRIADPEDTAIQLIGKVSAAVGQRETSSDLYDQPLLKHLRHWQSLFKHELKQLQLPSILRGQENPIPVKLDIQVVENAKILSAQVPLPRQVRVVGKLDMVRHSTRSFGLVLDRGEEVRGIFLESDPELLRQLLGCEVTVLGKAVYRPSHSLLRIDAQEIVKSTEGRAAFSTIPGPFSRDARPERRTQSTRAGVAAFFGSWPGEETDEELLLSLGELRH